MKTTVLLLFGMIFALSGCGSGSSSGADPTPAAPAAKITQKEKRLTDQYNFPGEIAGKACWTKTQIFTAETKAELDRQYCAALTDDDLNHGCAKDLREKTYQQRCVERKDVVEKTGNSEVYRPALPVLASIDDPALKTAKK